MTESVESLLSAIPAPERIGPIPGVSGGAFPWRWSYGMEGPGKTRGTIMPALFVAMVVIVLGMMLAQGDLGIPIGLPQVVGIAAIAMVLVLFVVPRSRKAAAARTRWSRDVEIADGMVRVTDRQGGDSVTWTEPLSAYSDIHVRTAQRAIRRRTGPGGSRTEVEVAELRHANPGRSLYLHGTLPTGTGGMDPLDLIRAGYEGQIDEVKAAVGNRINPVFEAFVADLGAHLSLPVTRGAQGG